MKFAVFALWCSVGCSASFVTPVIVSAQDIGHAPGESPYRDIPARQQLSVFGGYFVASKDAIGAVPGNAPLFGVKYELPVGGPTQFFAKLSFAPSKRKAYDPSAPAANRALGEVSAPIYFADIGFSFNLTGQKSWRHLVPTAGFGAGIASSMKQTGDDPFKLGTKLSISTDLGLRYLPEGRAWEARVNLGNVMYQTKYPNAYYATAGDGTSLLSSGVSRSNFRINWVMSAGLSYPIFR